MTILKSFLGCVVLLAFVAGCSKNPTDWPSGPSGSIPETAAGSFAGTSGPGGQVVGHSNVFDFNSIQSTFTNTSSGTRSVMLPPIGRTTCEPTVSPDPCTDGADADGVPATCTYTFACSAEGLTFGGSFTITDKDDTLPIDKAGATLGITDLTMTGSFLGIDMDVLLQGTFDLTVASTTVTAEMAMGGTITASGNGQSATVETGTWMRVSATATSADDPSAGGTIGVNGFVKYNDGQTTDYIVQVASSEGLAYGGCVRTGTFLKSGYLTFTDGSSNVIKATFNDACAVTWTYNDTAVVVSR